MDEREIETERSRVRANARNQVMAIAIGIAVLVAAGLAAVILFGGDDETTGSDTTVPDTTVPDTTVPATTTTEPGDDAVSSDYPSLSTDHPLVGRTEVEARETYPLVRVTWVDGEALMTTMDLVPGRIDIAMSDATVVAAAAEGCEELPADAPLWMTQACQPSPDDGATVFGRLLQSEEDPTALFLEPGFDADRYYEGLSILPGEISTMVDLTGAPVNASDLLAGQSVWLWIGGPCAETFPVQCEIDALVVER